MTQSFDYDQYRRDSEESYRNPLHVQCLSEFEAIGKRIEIYALPGLDRNPNRYLLSLNNSATVIEKKGSATLSFLKSKKVKPLWAKDFVLLEFKTHNVIIPIKGVPKDVAREFWRKEDKKGNKEAELIIDILTDTSLDESVAIAFGIDRTFEERKANRILTAEEVILDDSRVWELHFNKEWQQQAQRITGHPWKRSIVMANFIFRTVYKRLPDEVYHRLVAVNEKRNYCHHQFFSVEADEYILRRHIQDVLSLMRVSDDKADFTKNYQTFFQGRGKLSMDINF
ncbi:MAG: hypothetical protein F6J98_01510 [Moorea sp. SIO4G2]|nr:hypothetical protein [Moorena sp. SIO4G2]